MRAISSLMACPKSKRGQSNFRGCFWKIALTPFWNAWLFEGDALFREVLHRAGMPGHGRGVFLLVLELDVLGFLVRAHQVVLVVEHRLHDAVRGLVVHVLVRDQQVVDR